MNLQEQLEKYTPFNEQEEHDRKLMLEILKTQKNVYSRENQFAHLTASAWVVNPDRNKVLMAYHNLYDSWAWLGGHADGEEDLLKVAIKEVQEESGLDEVRALSDGIFSIEILTVDGHVKNDAYVSSHLHLNVTYLLEADDSLEVTNKPDENQAVAWFELDEAIDQSSEPWFQELIYSKLNTKLRKWIVKENNDKVIKLASDNVVEGCMVLEGGALRGLYTQGVLDVLMEHDINLQTTIGVSAGAMGGMNYVSGQIGRSYTINMEFRHDPNYIGIGAFRENHGITGFSYLFNEISEIYPFDEERFNRKDKRFIAVATDVETGKAEYFENGKCSDIYKAVQASATVPYISEPVEIDGNRYLDGGIAEKIPYRWALDEGFEKIVVIRTRDEEFRKEVRPLITLIDREYRNMPGIKKSLLSEAPRYNIAIENIEQLSESGRIFVIAPSRPISISRFEGDLDALQEIYDMGREDAQNNLEALKKYLEIS